jgi:thioesterase domain-containing protein
VISRRRSANRAVHMESLMNHSFEASVDAGLAAVTIRAHGTQRPLFLIPESSGTDTYFSALAKYIDADIPIYGIICGRFDDAYPKTIEALATHFARKIRTVQPLGPYRIAGWSWGGTLAYEIATQLIGQDETVEFIGLLGIEPSARRAASHERDAANAADMRMLDQMLGRHDVQDEQRDALSKLRDTADDVSLAVVLQKAGEIVQAAFPSSTEAIVEMGSLFSRAAAHIDAAAGYVEEPISTSVHLFIPEDRSMEDRSPRQLDDLLGWASVLPKHMIKASRVPGNHLSIMSEHVEQLGAAVSAALNAIGPTDSASLDSPYRPIVTIATGAWNSPTLFCVPGAGDSVSTFIGLSSALGDAWSVHGLEYRGLDNLLVPHSTVEAAATTYVRAIEDSRRTAPIHVLGHSFGGWIAFEMVRQLVGAGRVVASLTIVDSDVPGHGLEALREYSALEAFGAWIRVLELVTEQKSPIDADKLRQVSAPERLKLAHAWLVRIGLLSRRSTPESLRGGFRTFCSALRTTYQPLHTLRGPVHLVLVRDTTLDEAANQRKDDEAVRGWRHWVPGLEYWQGPGNHMTIFRHPHVDELMDWWLQAVSFAGASDGTVSCISSAP